ncbi:MAG: TetR/AcrR family transcriptional regulator [Planctomycetota bacterium]
MNETADTPTRILDAAERLFAERGFDAVGLRGITQEAGANLAAVNYHFGSKEQLLFAVLARRLEPLNRERLQRLDKLEAAACDAPLPVADICQALFAPLRNHPAVLGCGSFGLLLARMHLIEGERGRLREFVESVMGQVRRRFSAAFARALPQLDGERLFYRSLYLIGAMRGAMMHLDQSALPFPQPAAGDPGGVFVPERIDRDCAIDELVRFAVGGMEAE